MRTARPIVAPLSDELVELIAGRFRALADPTRIRLLELLTEQEHTVAELTAAVGSTQQNVSKHLALLLHAGIVARRREGSFAHYRLVDPTVRELCETVCTALADELDRRRAAMGGLQLSASA